MAPVDPASHRRIGGSATGSAGAGWIGRSATGGTSHRRSSHRKIEFHGFYENHRIPTKASAELALTIIHTIPTVGILAQNASLILPSVLRHSFYVPIPVLDHSYWHGRIIKTENRLQQGFTTGSLILAWARHPELEKRLQQGFAMH